MVKYVYGPVPSRRLGQSLGVSPIPEKTCNYNCVYCQLGKTTHFTNKREHFFNPHKIITEIKTAINYEKKIDYITFVGEGEPTLCKDLGFLIDQTKTLTDLPIAVITNGSLLSHKSVRDDLKKVDVIIPTFDAATSKLFRYINRPHKGVTFADLTAGLQKLRNEFSNEIWIEVMLLKNINDSLRHLESIKGQLDIFHPDQVQINIPSRPPTEPWVQIPENKALKLAQIILQPTQTLPLNEVGYFDSTLFKTPLEAIFSITKRHPLQYSQALEILLQFDVSNPTDFLNNLIHSEQLKLIEYHGRNFIYRV